MIIALRYVEKDGGSWEVRTEKSIESYISLRQFPQQQELAALAARALQEPGMWIHIGNEREQEICE